MNYNLIAAILWFVAGVVLMTFQARYPDNRWFTINLGEYGLSSGWLALLLAMYNVARWYSTRAAAQQRRLEAAARPVHRPEERVPPAGQAPDPNFDFSRPPPGPEGERGTAGGPPPA